MPDAHCLRGGCFLYSLPRYTHTSRPLEKGTVMLVYPLPGARTYASKSAYRCAEEIELSIMTMEPLRKCGWTSLSVGSARGAQTSRVSPAHIYIYLREARKERSLSSKSRSTVGRSVLSVSSRSPSLKSIYSDTPAPTSFHVSLARAALLGSFSVAITLHVAASRCSVRSARARYIVLSPNDVPACIVSHNT